MKRANIDIMSFIFFGIIIIIVVLFMAVIMNKFKDMTPTVNNALCAGNKCSGVDTITARNADNNKNGLDAFLVAVFVGMFLFIIISAFLINVSPAFFVVGVILFIIALLFGGLVGRGLVTSITNSPTLTEAANSLPMTTFIIQHWTAFIIIVGIVGLVVTYGKFNTGGGA